MITLKLNKGAEKVIKDKFPEGATFFNALAHINEDIEKPVPRNIIAVKVDGVLMDLSSPVPSGDLVIEPVITESPDGLEIIRHTTAHIMAQAIREIFPDTDLTIGPVIENGFYYDFDTEHHFTPEDFKKIEDKMAEIVKANYPISREELSYNDAKKRFASEPYKLEIMADISDENLSVYKQHDFEDLCRGPHLPSTGYLKAFKITAIAGAYWRGDEKNKMLQRVYGTAFASKKELKQHLFMLEEAKKRDHRKLGKELDLFSISEDIGSGLVLWHPKGARVRSLIEDFWKKEHYKNDYSLINTPHVAKVDLWKKSGHWDFYQENLFSPMDVDGQDYIVKPMNCPFHIEVFNSNLRSYRDLPIRYAELGTVYRYERSGVLHGLLRVRGFTQDDAHLYMRQDQLEEEIRKVLRFILYILGSFGFNRYDIYLSTRPSSSVGSDEDWAKAEDSLSNALKAENLDYIVDPGEGVFYGPKIDIKIKDSIGRSWQCSTVQVDFNLPERFDLTYRDEDGGVTRPIMVHRALMGSLERFFGCLIEHYSGAFPVWLAPVQVKVLTVTDRNNEYAEKVVNSLREKDIRVELDKRNEKLGLKIRESQLEKVPYMLIVGDQDESDNTVSPRSREDGATDAVSLEDFIEKIKKEDVVGDKNHSR